MDRVWGQAWQRVRRTSLFWRYVCLRFWNDDLFTKAAALSFQTALAIVPLMTIAISVLSAFPGFRDFQDQLQTWLLQILVPHLEQVVADSIQSFVSKARQLTTLGIVVLAVIAMLLLHTASNTFDAIFRVKHQRPLPIRFMTYWTVLSLGPLLFGLGLSLSAQLVAESRQALGGMVDENVPLFRSLLPPLIEFVAFLFIYWVAPSQRVRISDAAAAAFLAMVLFQVLKTGFALYALYFSSYGTIYGAVAAIPFALIWLELAWSATLFGATVAASLREWRSGQADPETGELRTQAA